MYVFKDTSPILSIKIYIYTKGKKVKDKKNIYTKKDQTPINLYMYVFKDTSCVLSVNIYI